MYGASDAPKIPAMLKASEDPVYRTAVGNNSDTTVPSGPYLTPISARPTIIIHSAPFGPAANIFAMDKPNTAISTDTPNITGRLPRSASQAESGIVAPKKTT